MKPITALIREVCAEEKKISFEELSNLVKEYKGWRAYGGAFSVKDLSLKNVSADTITFGNEGCKVEISKAGKAPIREISVSSGPFMNIHISLGQYGYLTLFGEKKTEEK